MKKLVTAIVAIFVSLSAHAATVYDKDGTKVDVKGDMQIQLRQKVGEDEDLKMDYDDLTVGFGVKHKGEDGWTSFSLLKMDWKKQASGDAKAAVDEGFIGVSRGPLSVSIGRLDWGSDSFYVDEAVEIGYEVIAAPETKGYESIQAKMDMGMAALILSGDLEVEDNSSAAEAYLVTHAKKFAGLEIGALYQSFQPETVPADEEAGTDAVKPDAVDTVGIRVAYAINKVSLGADYTTNDDINVMNASVKAKVTDSSSVAVGHVTESPDGGDDVSTWYANVKHKLNKYSTVFAEIGNNDEDDSEIGYLTGMKVKF